MSPKRNPLTLCCVQTIPTNILPVTYSHSHKALRDKGTETTARSPPGHTYKTWKCPWITAFTPDTTFIDSLASLSEDWMTFVCSMWRYVSVIRFKTKIHKHKHDLVKDSFFKKMVSLHLFQYFPVASQPVIFVRRSCAENLQNSICRSPFSSQTPPFVLCASGCMCWRRGRTDFHSGKHKCIAHW